LGRDRKLGARWPACKLECYTDRLNGERKVSGVETVYSKRAGPGNGGKKRPVGRIKEDGGWSRGVGPIGGGGVRVWGVRGGGGGGGGFGPLVRTGADAGSRLPRPGWDKKIGRKKSLLPVYPSSTMRIKALRVGKQSTKKEKSSKNERKMRRNGSIDGGT